MRIGVVVIAHNVEPWIGQALRSVAVQTHTPDHVVVVENGSTDGTLDTIEAVLSTLDGALPVTVCSEPALGANGARNLGADRILPRNVQAIAFLDGDDWWESNFLESVSQTLIASERRAAAFGCATIRKEDGSWLGLRLRLRRDYNYSDLCRVRSPMLTASALMIRSEDFARVQGFAPELRAATDWEMCLRLTRAGKSLGCTPRCVVNYRKRHGQITRDAAAIMRGQLEVERHHPTARRGKHWWWLLNLALRTGDADLVAQVRERFPSLRPTDLFSPQYLKHLLLRLRVANGIEGKGSP